MQRCARSLRTAAVGVRAEHDSTNELRESISQTPVGHQRVCTREHACMHTPMKLLQASTAVHATQEQTLLDEVSSALLHDCAEISAHVGAVIPSKIRLSCSMLMTAI
jgi:hypothetical protein